LEKFITLVGYKNRGKERYFSGLSSYLEFRILSWFTIWATTVY